MGLFWNSLCKGMKYFIFFLSITVFLRKSYVSYQHSSRMARCLWCIPKTWYCRETSCSEFQLPKGPSMFFYPDFIQIKSGSNLGKMFFPTLSRFYPNFIQIFRTLFYPDFIQILSRFYQDFWKTHFIQISSRFYSNFIQIF